MFALSMNVLAFNNRKENITNNKKTKLSQKIASVVFKC